MGFWGDSPLVDVSDAALNRLGATNLELRLSWARRDLNPRIASADTGWLVNQLDLGNDQPQSWRRDLDSTEGERKQGVTIGVCIRARDPKMHGPCVTERQGCAFLSPSLIQIYPRRLLLVYQLYYARLLPQIDLVYQSSILNFSSPTWRVNWLLICWLWFQGSCLETEVTISSLRRERYLMLFWALAAVSWTLNCRILSCHRSIPYLIWVLYTSTLHRSLEIRLAGRDFATNWYSQHSV